MTIDDEPQYPNRKNESHPNGKEKEGKRRTFLGMHIGGGKDKDKEKDKDVSRAESKPSLPLDELTRYGPKRFIRASIVGKVSPHNTKLYPLLEIPVQTVGLPCKLLGRIPTRAVHSI